MEYFRKTSLGPNIPSVCRLGLATRGNTALDPDDVHRAIEAGVNYLNWCGYPDGMSRAVRELGAQRKDVVLAVQLSATRRDGMKAELEAALEELGTDWIDVPTFYYMESREQWQELCGTQGGYDVLKEAQAEGLVRRIGLTSHQRWLAAELVEEGFSKGLSSNTGQIDLLMIRYNAAHTGAELEIFPVTDRLEIPVIAYTCIRWGELPKSTPDDPPGFVPPPAPFWYRWVLQNPSVSVAIMAPNGRAELEQNLEILADWRPLDESTYRNLCRHGARVYRHASSFP